MALTKVRYAMVSGIAENVVDYGADPTGATESTTAIQAAIDTGNSVYFPAGTYKVSGLTIEDKQNVSYFSDGPAIITNVGTTKTSRIFEMVGTLIDVTFDGFEIIGDGTTDTENVGWGCSSGQTIRRAVFRNIYIKDTKIGISLNADLSGTIEKCIVEDCHFQDIVGVDPAQGYGVHLPNAFDTTVTSCTFDNIQRHGVYVPRGGNVVVSDCHFKNHRSTVSTGSTRAACDFARTSRNCSVTNSIFEDCYDGCVSILSESAATSNNEGSTVSNCKFYNPLSVSAVIEVGEKLAITGSGVDQLNIYGCVFVVDATAKGGGPIITVENGKHISIHNNLFRIKNMAGDLNAIVIGDNTYSANQGDLEYVSIIDNQFFAKGTSGNLRGVAVEGYLGSDVDQSIWVDTKFAQIDAGLTYQQWASPTYSFANTGLQGAVGRSTRTNICWGTAAPVAGTWNRGDIVWDVTPSAGGTMGWVCTTGGTPGTWKTFGTIAV